MLSTKKYIFVFYQQQSVVEQLNKMQESASGSSLVPRCLKNQRGVPGIHCLRMHVKIRSIFRITYRDM